MQARYYEGGRGQFLSQDPVFWEVGQTNDGKTILTNPQLANSYSYAGNNPVNGKDPSGRLYVEFSVSGALPIFGPGVGISGSTGIRIDTKGVDWFYSSGPSIGAEATIGVSLSSGNLSHKPELSVSREGRLAAGAGMGISRDGTFDSKNPLSLGKDQSTSFSVVAGVGGSLSQSYTQTIPIKLDIFSGKEKENNRNTQTPPSSSSKSGPQSVSGGGVANQTSQNRCIVPNSVK